MNVKAPQKKPSLKPGARGQTVENPQLESEARRAADRVLARKSVDTLSARPASALPGDAGGATALTAGPRARLETAFGADLSGLRIHTNPAAQALARSLNARAFAAGQHLVFAEGAFRPHDPAGLRLIAHETAHALQQTGGDMQTHHPGARQVDPQRENGGEGNATTPETEAKVDLWEELKSHRVKMKDQSGGEYKKTDKRYAADVALMDKAIGTDVLLRDTSTAASQRLVELIGKTYFKTLRARGLAFDVLAHTGEHDAANTYLTNNLQLEVGDHNKAFAHFFFANANGPVLFTAFLDLKQSPFVKGKWQAFRDYIKSLMTDPKAADPPTNAIIGDLRDNAVFFSPDQLKVNLAQLQMLITLQNQLDVLVNATKSSTSRDTIAIQFGEASGSAMPNSLSLRYLMRLFAIRHFLNNGFISSGERDETGMLSGPPPSAGAVYDRISREFGKEAKNAFQGATLALGLASSMAKLTESGARATDDVSHPDLTSVSQIKSFFSEISNALNPKETDGLFALNDLEATGDTPTLDKDKNAATLHAEFLKRLPTAKTFGKRRKIFLDRIKTKSADMAKSMATTKIMATSEGGALDKRNTLLAALMWSDWLAHFIADQKIEGGAEQMALARFNISNAMGIGAKVFGHNALLTKTSEVFEAKDAKLSYAIIPKGFEKSTSIKFDALTGEMPWVQVVPTKDGSPKFSSKLAISTENLVRFFRFSRMMKKIAKLDKEIKRLDAIADKRLGQTLEEEMKDPNPRDPVSLTKKLEEAADEVAVPELYSAKDGRLVMNPNDKSSSTAEVQLRHPKVQALLGHGAASGADASSQIFKDKFLLRQEGLFSEVYFWVLPPLDDLWTALKNSTEISAVITMFESEVSTDGMDSFRKLHQLQVWVESKSKVLGGPLLGIGLDVFFKRRTDEEDANMKLKLRELTAVNRKIARNQMIKFLTAYRGELKGIFLASIFGRTISDFIAVVQPKEDQKLQMVLLLLEAVEQLETVVSTHKNYDSVALLLPHITMAMSFIRGTSMAGVGKASDLNERQKDKEAIATSKANIALLHQLKPEKTDLSERHERLAGVMKILLETRAGAQKTWTLYADPDEGMNTELSPKKLKPGDAHSSFILALWSNYDVNKPQGHWYWDEVANKANPMDAASGKGEPTQTGKPARTVSNTKNPIFYRFDKVHQEFEFVPAFARSDGSAQIKDANGTIKGNPKLATISLANMYGDGKSKAVQTMDTLRTVDIYAEDLGLLTLLAAVIDTQSRNAQLQDLGKMIEAGVELALDLAEFIPGYGQALMVARIAANITQAIVDGDLEEMKADMIDTPIELVDFISDEFFGKLSGDLLWKYLLIDLFGSHKQGQVNQLFKKLTDKAGSKAKREPKEGKGKTEKYKQLAKAISGIGMVFVKSLLKAQQKAGVGVNSASAKIASSPRIAPHIGKIDVYAAWIGLAADLISDKDLMADLGLTGDPARDIRAQVIKLQETFDPKTYAESIGEMFDAISSFELPEEVVPVDLLVLVAIDFLLARAGNKKVKFVYEALRLTGLLPEIAKAVEGHLIKGSAADPNHYWRKHVREAINEPFTQGRDEFVKTLMNYTNALFPGITIPSKIGGLPALQLSDDPLRVPDAGKPGAASDDAGDTPEVQQFNLSGDPRHRHPGPLPDQDGRPLDAALRETLQQAFGHDLSHVRVHDGPGADNYVSATGAEALASGSNIYLRSDADHGGPMADHILRHEVAHVLQQTGPRPLGNGDSYDPRPITGAPGRGVQMDPGRETGADAMAHAARARHSDADAPIEIRGRGPKSLAPAFTNSDMYTALIAIKDKAGAANFTKTVLGDVDLITTDQNMKKSGMSPIHGKSAIADGAKMHDELHAKLGEGDWNGTPPFGTGSAMTKIKAEAQHAWALSKKKGHAAALVDRAVTELPKSRWKGTKGKEDRYALNPRAYMNILTGYFFEQTGILIYVMLNKKNPLQIDKVKYHQLHIGRLRALGDTALYRTVVEDNPDEDFGGDIKFKFAQARAYFKTRFPKSHGWASVSGKFRIPLTKRKEIAKLYKSSLKSLNAQDLPTWKEYIKTKDGGLGLRVDNHGVLTKRDQKNKIIDNTGRESHHLPQFLLSEFYAGASAKSNILGRDGSYWTPGFSADADGEGYIRPLDGAEIKLSPKFASPKGKVNFGNLGIEGTGRGLKMPAVSLAARTHKKGGLHLPTGPNPDKEDIKSSPTQGFMIASKHREALRARVAPLKGSLGLNKPPHDKIDINTAAGFKDMVNVAMKTKTSRLALQSATFEAMQDSYVWMVTSMRGWLDTALDQHELDYYRILASEKFPTWDHISEASRDYIADPSGSWKSDVMAALKVKNSEMYGELFVASAW